jgi:hypothetical protein
MRLIGTVTRLQIQESSLKVGENPRRYDPSPLRPIPALEVSTAGVVALDEDGSCLIDIHNQQHPASKNVRGVNGLSFGFTTHYAKMRERFGPHLTNGIAGENILIQTDRTFGAEELAGGVLIEGIFGRRLELSSIVVAAPCVEFTRYAMRISDIAQPDKSVTEGLQFLHNGMRGFYAGLEGGPGTIRLGDRVFLP